MEHRNRIILAAAVVAIVAVLAASYLIIPDDSHERRAHAFPDPIQDGDKDYPTAAEAQESYEKAIASLESSLSDASLGADAVKKAISDAEHSRDVLIDKFLWVSLDYNKDPSRMSTEYQAWSILASGAKDSFSAAVKGALSGPCAGTVEAALKDLGEDPEKYRGYDEHTPEEKALLQRQTELKAQYDAIKGTEYTATDAEGRTWTLKTVAESITLTDEERKLLTAEIYEAQCTDAAAVYVELVQVNNGYAKLRGYSDYVEYSYSEVYGRGYSASDVKSLTALAGQAFSLGKDGLALAGYTQERLRQETEWFYGLDADGLIENAAPFIRSLSQDHSDLLDYMLEYGLINICDDESRIRTAYSEDIITRGSAVIFLGTTGSGPNTMRSLVHEFGHSSNSCLTPNKTVCYDVAEIHSQGLESLYSASGLIGHGSENAFAAYKMSGFASTLSSSLVMTEFEIWAYETQAESGSLTAEQACEKFADILDGYGISYSLPYDQKYYWARVLHLFQYPNYYISYGTSVINAMEIYLDAIDDYGSAKEKYFSLLFQEGVEGYIPAVEKAGLSNALDAERSKEILDGIEEALKAMAS